MSAGRKHSALVEAMDIARSRMELEWCQRCWSDNEARMMMLKRAMQQDRMGKQSVADILSRVTRKAKGLTKGDDEWDAAERWTASRETKRRILSQVAGVQHSEGSRGAGEKG